MTGAPFSSSVPALVGADGTALAVLRSSDPRTVLLVSTVGVLLSTGPGEARLYDSPAPDQGRFLFGSYSGDRDTATDVGLVIRPGDGACVQWTGATPGAMAVAVFRGRAEVER